MFLLYSVQIQFSSSYLIFIKKEKHKTRFLLNKKNMIFSLCSTIHFTRRLNCTGLSKFLRMPHTRIS